MTNDVNIDDVNKFWNRHMKKQIDYDKKIGDRVRKDMNDCKEFIYGEMVPMFNDADKLITVIKKMWIPYRTNKLPAKKNILIMVLIDRYRELGGDMDFFFEGQYGLDNIIDPQKLIDLLKDLVGDAE